VPGARRFEHPERHAAGAEIERPALPRREIDKRNPGGRRAAHERHSPDVRQISERRGIPGQQDMGAVVDAHAGHGIVVGTTAAAGLFGRLVDDGRHPALSEADGR
jgi:hypothetical protein